MSLENAMTELTAALNRNSALLEAAQGTNATKTETAAASGTKAATTKAAAAPKITADEVKAKAVEVKEKLGQPAAKKIIKEAGLADSLAAMDKKNYAAFMAAADAALAGDGAEEAAEEDEL